jgi:gliding motility-associated-like protein
MKQMKYIITVVLFLSFGKLWATHNRAGEITYRQIGSSPFTLEFTLTTYTNIGPTIQADRCTMTFHFGDGDTCTAYRENGPSGTCPGPAKMGEVIQNATGSQGGIKKNIYRCIHTFAGGGSFTVFVLDENRNDGINNIPNSVDVPFYVETVVTLSPFLGANSGAVLYNPPIDNACVCKRFVHNPNAIDPDNDSLSYALGICKGAQGNNILGYSIPQGVTLNPVTGDLVWECPTPQGEFNFVILIISWRAGIPIDSITRDMQVTVDGSCINNPPVLQVQNICVDAGTFVDIPITATDPDNHNVTLTATGAVFNFNPNPANFSQNITGPTPLTSNFTWQTSCSNVRKAPYQVSFKAVDIPLNINDQPLSDIKTIQITVVSPPPTNLTATPQGTSIILNWNPTICTQATGYKIYRRNGPSGFVPATCQTGVPASTGYSLINTLPGVGSNTFTDDNNGQGLIHGIDYCYMICAYFTDGAESYASNEDCVTLKKDVPIITHVTVDTTAIQAGKNTIIWSPPRRSELDTITYPGPYKYIIFRSSGANCNNLTPVDSIVNVNLPGTATDTLFQHINVDTYNNSNSYRVGFYNENPRLFIGSSHCASSIYLDIVPSDNSLTLDWTSNVPWSEDSFVVFRQNPTTLIFDSIGTSSIAQYTDNGLTNGTTYCYKVKSYGHYSEPGIVKPLINFSQEACGVPVDNVAPCAPDLALSASCDSILNTLSWNNPNLTCADDVLQYKIYFSTNDSANFNLIATINEAGILTFTHNNNDISIAGCYYITALDSNSNESLSSDTVCSDNCPEYLLPNIFTPNGDGVNDEFRPFPYKFIESIDMKIYNRWGGLVFSTNNPEVLWNGTNQQSKQPCSDGVYYYICDFTSIRLQGNVTETLHGFVQLFTSIVNGGK